MAEGGGSKERQAGFSHPLTPSLSHPLSYEQALAFWFGRVNYEQRSPRPRGMRRWPEPRSWGMSGLPLRLARLSMSNGPSLQPSTCGGRCGISAESLVPSISTSFSMWYSGISASESEFFHVKQNQAAHAI